MILRCLILLAVMFLPSVGLAAAPTYDSSVSVSSATGSTTLETGSWTIGGSDRYLICGVASGAGTPVDVTAVKWGGSGGTSMTQQGSTIDIGSFLKLSIWKLLAPTAQSSTVHATWGSTQDERFIACVSANGVDQTTPIGTMATATGLGSNTATVNVTTATDDFVIDVTWAFDGNGGAPTLAVGAGQTSRQEKEGAPLLYQAGGASTEVATGGTTTMSWTYTPPVGTMDWGIAGIPLKPLSGGGGSTVRGLTLMGVGQ